MSRFPKRHFGVEQTPGRTNLWLLLTAYWKRVICAAKDILNFGFLLLKKFVGRWILLNWIMKMIVLMYYCFRILKSFYFFFLILLFFSKFHIAVIYSLTIFLWNYFPLNFLVFEYALLHFQLSSLNKKLLDLISELILLFRRRLPMKLGSFEHCSLLFIVVLSEMSEKRLSLEYKLFVAG